MISATNQITLDELYQDAKKCCAHLVACRSKLGFKEARKLSEKELNYIPFTKTDEAFTSKKPQDMTNVIIAIASQLSDIGCENSALDILDKARKTSLSKEQYRNNFFSHKTCLEKINTSYEKIFNKKMNKKSPENNISELSEVLANMYIR
ncbi:Uncharacterised protein [Legionella beliardensis]|uniref:Uncharacterized protein n=2 Tax=Legionella beliardensis TaxID=91822 RepID=A0A378I121_9GAMM|nr:Uncharacterised protein [Legionella beliardensis]